MKSNKCERQKRGYWTRREKSPKEGQTSAEVLSMLLPGDYAALDIQNSPVRILWLQHAANICLRLHKYIHKSIDTQL